MNLADMSGATRIPLIGRRTLLQDAAQRLAQGGAHLVYFEGRGGIGKTALLEAILDRSREEDAHPAAHIASQIIDLYHVDVHAPEGLIYRIMQVMGNQHFEKTQQVVHDLAQARSSGNIGTANEKAENLRQTFLNEFDTLMDESVVLAFDTTEVLEFERDPFQTELGTEVPILSAGEWLFKSLFPRLQGNTLILLAGRPDGVSGRLDWLSQTNHALQLHHVQLEALSAEETKEYLTAVAQMEAELGNSDAVSRLRAFAENRVEVVHLLTGGRPILLALVCDMVAHGWALPASFGRPIQDLQDRDAEAWWPDIERSLVVRIQESPAPIGETIQALAWLRKGATPKLMAMIMDLTTTDGQWDIETATDYLDQVSNLTLVKIRPNEGRIFLHDEMYSLLEKYVLEDCGQEEQNRVYGAILQYYDELADELEGDLAQTPIQSTTHAHLRQAYVENIHYSLCHRPSQGFSMFFWLAEEAGTGRDIEMDMLLRSELLRTVVQLRAAGQTRDRPALDGLDPREVEIDTAIRWGMRALYFRNDPEGALQILERVRQQWAKEIQALELTEAHLQLYLAAAWIERANEGDWAEARRLLHSIGQKTDRFLGEVAAPPAPSVLFRWARENETERTASTATDQRWRARTLKAAALNYEGFLARQEGRYAAAIDHYQAATLLQRRLGMSSLVPTLTALAHTMVLMGQFHHARLLAQEAERWARHSGKEYVLARALTARALVEEYDGRTGEALQYTNQALKLAEGMEASQARGMIYLTRARVHRHQFLSGEDQDRASQVLEEALKDANQAVNLLKSTPASRVTALIERGCMHREIARVHYLQKGTAQAVKAARKSQEDLERAAALAGAMDLFDQQALAWTNLGWLWYYTGQTDQAGQALERVYRAVPPDYLFPDSGGRPPMAKDERIREASLPFWSTLGKAEMLQAYIALDEACIEAKGHEHAEKLQTAAEHITLSLAYDEQVAGEYFTTRAERDLHKRILNDNLAIGDLHRFAHDKAKERKLKQPTRFQEFLTRMFGPGDLWS